MKCELIWTLSQFMANKEFNTYEESVGGVHVDSQMSAVGHDLNASAGVKHCDDVRHVLNARRLVESHSSEVL